jgi:hypothetical protein
MVMASCSKQTEIAFDWEATESDLIVTLQAPTKGWIAVGFPSTKTMKDANFIIGFVKNNKVYLRDDYATGFDDHESDLTLGGIDNVKLIKGSEKRGITRISFSIPLISGDQFDPDIEMNTQTAVFLAYGSHDDFSSTFTWKVVRSIEFELTIPDCCVGG